MRNRRPDPGPFLVVDVHKRIHVRVRRAIGRGLLAVRLLGRGGSYPSGTGPDWCPKPERPVVRRRVGLRLVRRRIGLVGGLLVCTFWSSCFEVGACVVLVPELDVWPAALWPADDGGCVWADFVGGLVCADPEEELDDGVDVKEHGGGADVESC